MGRQEAWLLAATVLYSLWTCSAFVPQWFSSGLSSSCGIRRVSRMPNACSRGAVTIRQAREKDFQAIAELRCTTTPIVTSGSAGFLGDRVVIDDPKEARRRALLAKVSDLMNGEAVAVVALDGANVVGTVDCIIDNEDLDGEQEAGNRYGTRMAQGTANVQGHGGTRIMTGKRVFLRNMFVLPDWRRQGVGRQLLQGAEAFAKKSRAGVLVLEVSRDNEAASGLYTSTGFLEDAGERSSLGSTLLRALGIGNRVMTKLL